ncbi:MAG: hypothetical protein P8Y70_02355 [Candidatus Lokiarchaeota archaeon]
MISKLNIKFNIIKYPIFGILSALTGLLGDLLSSLFFKGYNFFTNYVSDLGVSKAGLIFNLSIIFSGILVIPVSISFYILIGIFPSDKSVPISFIMHGVVALVTWLSGIVYLSLFGILMILDDKYNKFLSLTCFIQGFLIFFFLITWQPIIEWVTTAGIIVFLFINSIYMIYKKF